MITLAPATADVARATIAGRLDGVAHVGDWPHADTADALRALAEHPDVTTEGTFLVLRDGVVVGECGWFGPPDASGEVEISYGLAPSARRQGAGTEALGLLLDWVGARGATTVRAEVLPGNEPSLRLLRRHGFRVHGQRAGHVVLVKE